MIALVPVRSGHLPAGAGEVTEEASGAVVLAGSGTRDAAVALQRTAAVNSLRLAELGGFAPAAWARRLASFLVGSDVVLLPASPDGRDLAPRLARAMGRPLASGATAVSRTGATVVRHNGGQLVRLAAHGPFVATLLPGSRSCRGGGERRGVSCEEMSVGDVVDDGRDATSLEEVEPSPSSLALRDAARVVVAGGGAVGAHGIAPLVELASLLGAATGVTRVVSDSGVAAHDRQIGTSGVAVSPRLYLAFGVSGAPHHVAAIGEPEHIVSVNRDGGCPMMEMADLAVVADAEATARELSTFLRRVGD